MIFKLLGCSGASPGILRGGGGAHFEAVRFPAQSQVKNKKKVNTSADVQFSAQSQVNNKKKKKRSTRPQMSNFLPKVN